MIVTLHLCAPEGEALRQQLSDLLNTLKRDNRYVINAMLHSGLDVPDTVVEAGLEYVPSRHQKSQTGEPIQVYYGMRAIFESGTFSCAEAAAYEAAVMEEKYNVPTECLAVAFDDGDHHAIFVTPDGEVDPTENYLRRWEQRLELPSRPVQPRMARKYKGRRTKTSCNIVDGRVTCDVRSGTCVDVKKKVWRSSDSALNGRRVQISEVFRGQNSKQRWARTKAGVFVPVCGGR